MEKEVRSGCKAEGCSRQTMAAATTTFAQLKNFCDTFYLIFMTHTHTRTHNSMVYSQATPHIVIYRPQVVAESLCGLPTTLAPCVASARTDRQADRQRDSWIDRQPSIHKLVSHKDTNTRTYNGSSWLRESLMKYAKRRMQA